MTRQGSARCTSALLPLNIPYKAVTDRRYRRNRLVHFYRHLVRTGIAFPRLPRAQSALAMTNRRPLPFYRYPIRIGGAAPGAACRSPTAHGRRFCVFFILHFSVFRIHFHAPLPCNARTQTFHFHPALPLHITLQISSFYGKSTKIRGGTRNVR